MTESDYVMAVQNIPQALSAEQSRDSIGSSPQISLAKEITPTQSHPTTWLPHVSDPYWQALIEAAPAAIIATDLNGRIMLWNEAAERLFGWSAHEVVGQPLPIIPEELQSETAGLHQRLHTTRSPINLETRRRRKDGTVLDVDLAIAPWHDFEGQILGAIGLLTDISQRKHAERALRQSEQRFAAAFNNHTVAIGIASIPDGFFLAVNERFLELLGYAREKVIGYTYDDFGYGISEAQRAEWTQMLYATGSVHDVLVQFNRHGAPVEALLSLELITLDDTPAVLFLLHDITAQRKAERTAQRYAEVRQHLLDIAQIPLATTTPIHLVQQLLETLRKLVPFDLGDFRWVDHSAGVLRATVQLDDHVLRGLDLIWDLPLGTGIMGGVALSGRGERVNDASTDPRSVYPPNAKIQKEHLLCLPIKVLDQVIGVVAMARFADPPYTQEEFELAQVFINHVAATLDNARLVEQVQAHASQLEQRVQERTTALAVANRELLNEISIREQTEIKLLYQYQYLNALNETAVSLMSHMELDAVLTRIIEHAATLAETPHGFLYLLEPDGQTMRIRVGVGLHVNRTHHDVKIGEGLAGVVWQLEQPLVVDDYARWQHRLPNLEFDTVHTVAGVPLRSHERIMGVLGVSYVEPERRLNRIEVERLERFAQLAAIALDNTRLLEQTQHRNNHISVINAVARALAQQLDLKQLFETIYEQVRRLLITDGFFVCLFDAENNLVTYPIVYDRGQRHYILNPEIPTGHTLQVLQSGKPLLINHPLGTSATVEDRFAKDQIIGNDAEIPEAMLYVPLQLGQKTVGVISTQSYRADVYGEAELFLLSDVANYITVALENARLYSTVQQELIERKRVQRTQNVQYAVAQALADSLTLNEAATTLLRVVCEQLDWDVGEVWRIDPQMQVLRCVSIWHVATPEAAEFEALSRRFTFTRGNGLPGRVWASGRPLWIPNVIQDPYFPRAFLRARVGIHGAVGFPVQLGGETLGVIEFFSQMVKPVDSDLLDMFAAIGSQFGQFSERQRTQEALQAKERRLNDLLRRFVAHNVADQVLAQPDDPRLGGRRRVVSVLFADFRGYSEVSEMVEPEETMEALNRHFRVIGRIVNEHGGTINQYAGDMLMAIFNAPDDQPDHALRAVRSALAVQEALKALCEQELAANRLSFGQVGIGINTGPVVVGYLGFEERFDYTAIGDTTNIASRLSSLASSGVVLIGPQTYAAVQGKVQTRSIGSRQLKGRSNPVEVYEIIALTE